MPLTTMIFPPGITRFEDSRANVVQADATGRCTVDSALVDLDDYISAGFSQPPDVASATRPVPTYPGQPYFDTTLASGVGRPIWRRTDNQGWIDAFGTAV